MSPIALAENVLRSSVSPEFTHGLHVKYLQYMADKLSMKLDIYPMPFARRISALRQGQIDLMVGMQRENSLQDDVIYLQPHYEELQHTFFVLKTQQSSINSFEDLQDKTIGVTIHAKYYHQFNSQTDLALVAVSSLKQKIELLQKGRIDTFIHYKESTLPTLEKMGLSDKIVIANYQPTESHPYFATITTKSRLFERKDEVEKIIQQGVANGDFKRIRQLHYQDTP
ncbi:substrate-binding periplasmic protein [Neptunicella marina]|nr:transporter substrate-binding domain-containing protein [Neptunicella marina]